MIYQYVFEAPAIEVGGITYQKSRSQWLEFTGAEIPVSIENVSYVIEELRKDGIEAKTHQCKAIIDTGASMCVISKSIADKLHLHFERFTPVSFMEGGADLPTYPAIIKFEWGSSYFVPVVACELDDRFECFIGRDILAKFNLNYNGIEGIVTISDGNSSDDPPPNDPVNIFRDWYIRTLTFFGLCKKKKLN